jgi:hypothetical protein
MALLPSPSHAWLQLENALRQPSEQSWPGAGLAEELGALLGAWVATFIRVAMGGGDACTLVGAGTTK